MITELLLFANVRLCAGLYYWQTLRSYYLFILCVYTIIIFYNNYRIVYDTILDLKLLIADCDVSLIVSFSKYVLVLRITLHQYQFKD